METAYDTLRQTVLGSSAGWRCLRDISVLLWYLGIISKEYMSCQQTFNYIFQPRFDFVSYYLECRGAAIYIAPPKKINRVHNLEDTDTVEKVPNGRQIANWSLT